MGYARKSLISLQDTPYYHCIARCVRRCWLWGFDEYAGKDYSHRKQWVIDRIAFLTQVFAIEVCAYAVMSNHYHLVLYVDAERAQAWTQDEVIERWKRLFRLPYVVERSRERDALEAERWAAQQIVSEWRKRLMDVSWFMRCLNEHLARRANAEDDCTGRFWEGRFKSQALLDEAGLLTAMAYVDLNPVRAGIASAPEHAEFTSIYERIQRLRGTPRQPAEPNPSGALQLRGFADEVGSARGIPYTLPEYLHLVDWTGRTLRSGTQGRVDPQLPPILSRLGVDGAVWQELMHTRGRVFGRGMGRLDVMRLHAATLGQAWIQGMTSAAALFAR